MEIKLVLSRQKLYKNLYLGMEKRILTNSENHAITFFVIKKLC